MTSLTCPQCSSPVEAPASAPLQSSARARFKWQESLRSLLLGTTMVALMLAWGRDHWLLKQEIQTLKGQVDDHNYMLALASNTRISNLEKQLAESRIWHFRVNHGREVIPSLHAKGAEITADVTYITLQPPASDEDVAQLKQLPHLELVRLHGDQFTDLAVEHLSEIPSLRFAYVYSAALTDQSVMTLSQMTELKGIALGKAQITDDSLGALRSLPNLHTLVLDGTPITAAALTHIAELSTLRTLSLQTTTIGDEAIESLSQMNGLERLLLRKSKVTAEGIEQLRQALPDCQIEWK